MSVKPMYNLNELIQYQTPEARNNFGKIIAIHTETDEQGSVIIYQVRISDSDVTSVDETAITHPLRVNTLTRGLHITEDDIKRREFKTQQRELDAEIRRKNNTPPPVVTYTRDPPTSMIEMEPYYDSTLHDEDTGLTKMNKI